MKLNQRGIAGIVEILLILLVLGVLGFVGWRVLTNNKSTKQNDNSSAKADGKLSKIDTSQLKFDQAAATTDPIGDRRGPFYHDVYTATSTDGIHFSASNNKIAEHSSVPDAIKLPSGQLVFYAVDGAMRSQSGAMLGVSDDGGKTWKLGSLQLDGIPGGIADPQAVLTEDGRLRIYYTVFPHTATPGQPPASSGPNKINSAITSDGINFTKEAGDRIQHEQITDADVIKIGDTWFMYMSQGPKLLYATSDKGDGTFTFKGQVRDSGSVSKTVALGEGNYRQFYCDNQSGAINSQSSSDGIQWSNTATSLLNSSGSIICDPSPVQIGSNNWLMVYKVGVP